MDIPWNELEACGGFSDATKIPSAIELLFSDDPSKRQLGYWGIDNHAVVQSDLYSSAPYAARLIVDRLRFETTLYAEVVDVLYELHAGSNPATLTAGPLADKPIEQLCQRIVREAEPVLRARLPDADLRTRDLAASLLERFDAAPV